VTVNDREVCMGRNICVRRLVVDEWTRGCLRCLLVEQIVTEVAVSQPVVFTGTVEQDQL
jgi:hypothetical protein